MNLFSLSPTRLTFGAGIREYDEEEILHATGQAFADASHKLREDVILALRPALNSGRNVRPAPGREFIAGRSVEFDAAYAEIEVLFPSLWPPLLARISFDSEDVIRKEFESRSSSYRRRIVVLRSGALRFCSKSENTVCHLSCLSSVFVLFIGRPTLISKANKIREIISTLPEDVDALVAKLERTYIDTSKDEGGVAKGKGKGRERTKQGALAELQL